VQRSFGDDVSVTAERNAPEFGGCVNGQNCRH
jgi:hypothetical protein